MEPGLPNATARSASTATSRLRRSPAARADATKCAPTCITAASVADSISATGQDSEKETSRNLIDAGEILLPWPPRDLSPNARVHWSVRSRAARLYRKACWALILASGIKVDWTGPAHLWLNFYPPSRRHYDDDNLIASCKSGRDGIADALGINDGRFVVHPRLHDKTVKGGAVGIRITKGDEGYGAN